MLFDDRYRTLSKPAMGLFKDKGSRFIAYAYPIRSEEEAKRHMVFIKEEHPKARHHCWALRLSPDRSVFRINDDGEPSGTAGRPILNMLLSKDLTNILIVVVRYFGGTLLGVPGLINAYKTASLDALNNAAIVELTVNDVYAVSFDYLQMNELMKVVKEYTLTIISQNFENTCKLELEIPKAKLNVVLSKFETLAGTTFTYLRTT